jgi:hypothetical protein
MPTTWILPAPQQLPQDYFANQIPPTEVAVPPPDVTVPIVPPYVPPPATVTSGGVYYGPTPPADPQYGWLWTMGQGRLFVYMEPGIWTQVSTNW